MGKVKKKVNSRVLGMSPYVSNGVPQSCLDPLKICKLYMIMFAKLKQLILTLLHFNSFNTNILNQFTM